MKQRRQIYVLAGLLVILAVVVLYITQGDSPIAIVLGGEEKYKPIEVKDPALRLDRLESIRKLAYPGMKRDIFSGELPAPPQPVRPVVPVLPVGPVMPVPVVPKLELPFKFYGIAVDPRSGKRRAFFTNGEDVTIASEGDTLLTRYRLLRIGNTTADFEEVGTGLKATLQLEQPAQPPPQPPQG